MSKSLVVGVDDGHDGIKIYNGELAIQFRMPSRVAIGATIMGDPDDVNRKIISVNGNKYTVDEFCSEHIDTRTEDYPVSEANIALVYQALDKAFGKDYRDFKIATGLPLNRFYGGQDGTKNVDLIKNKTNNLMINLRDKSVFNLYEASNNLDPISISKHIVLSEAQCAYFDALMTDKGKKTDLYDDLFEGGCAVIDIGGRTTDIAVINPQGGTMQTSRCGTLDVGIITLKSILNQNIKAKLKMSSDISDWRLNKALDSGTLSIGKESHDVSDLISQAKDKVIEQIINKVKVHVRDGKDLGAVLLVGGGSITLGEQLINKLEYNNIQIVKDPEFANARGMYKCAAFMARI
ncbi:ParM/StbA family protein (plasmid) [Acinetobacter pittii]|uniref:ParM/StbA family protein n=1 Tax=Acinetobacter pittii TaxID=48296 RepID=UPI002030023A|nr:ParM/StbA family protein [Acinetobacter pittii]MCM1964135.1 ParM/StbA family protein [Acinetobacter pittii]MCM1980511.1 ParM/StbA family protein [Acinetobacter pittii]